MFFFQNKTFQVRLEGEPEDLASLEQDQVRRALTQCEMLTEYPP